jgi:hypothetical protein
MEEQMPCGGAAGTSAAVTKRPLQFWLLVLLGIVAYGALIFEIFDWFHVITDVALLTIAGTILLWTTGFAVALGCVAAMLGVLSALELKETGQPQVPLEAMVVE